MDQLIAPLWGDGMADVGRNRSDNLGQLFDVVYEHLREAARIQRRRQPSYTLNTTALVHEVFLKLVRSGTLAVHDRAHFLALAATAMRQILVSHARKHLAAKRGGNNQQTISLSELELAMAANPAASSTNAEALIALDDALTRLGERSDRQKRVVDCRFFAGLSIEETADALDLSPATVKRDWSLAQAWLYREIQEALQ